MPHASCTPPPGPSSPLLSAPVEVLFQIITRLDPVDIASVAQLSKAFYSYVSPDNVLLWKRVFEGLFDVPDEDQHQITNYSTIVKERCRARGIVRSPHVSKQSHHRAFVLTTLENILRTTPKLPLGTSKNAALLDSLLGSRSAVQDWLTATPPWSAAANPANSPQTRSTTSSALSKQLEYVSCHLHIAGMNIREIGWSNYKSGQAYREQVYRGTNFDFTNNHGPFEPSADGRLVVDFRMLNAIAVVMGLNIKSAWHQWSDEQEMNDLPYSFHHAVFYKSPGPGRDWAGVEGVWHYLYAFIDYNDYFAYNFAASQPGHITDLQGISEAVGGINTLQLGLSPDDEQDLANEDDIYPTLRFKGQSTGPVQSSFRGVVRMLDNGYRNWDFTIRYADSDRWQTSGVEIGGRGIYGIWTDVLHEDLSPCGPVWYFRAP